LLRIILLVPEDARLQQGRTSVFIVSKRTGAQNIEAQDTSKRSSPSLSRRPKVEHSGKIIRVAGTRPAMQPEKWLQYG
jgi:hypothetical protein